MIGADTYNIALAEPTTDNSCSIYNCAVFTTFVPNEQLVTQLPNASMSARNLRVVRHNMALGIATNKKNISILESVSSNCDFLECQLKSKHGTPPVRLPRRKCKAYATLLL